MTDHTIPADQDATTDRRGRATYLSPETIARTVERGIEQAHRYDTADQGDTIPADKVQDLIDSLNFSLTTSSGKGSDVESDRVTRSCIHALEALLPKPPTLADELRDEAENLSYPWQGNQLRAFADRVETLEKERDAAQAEIARLRARDNDDSPTSEPYHPTHLKTEEDYQNAPIGTIVQMEVPGWAHFIKDDEGCWATKGFIGYYTSESMSGTPCVVVEWGTEPVETPQPEYIDPASCGRYRPYLVKVDGKETEARRVDDGDYPWVSLDYRDYFSDEDVKVIRPLSVEEMDAR